MSQEDPSFEEELVRRLRHEKLLFIAEIREIGQACGLDKSQVAARLAHMTQKGAGFKAEVYVSADVSDSDADGRAIVKKFKEIGPYG